MRPAIHISVRSTKTTIIAYSSNPGIRPAAYAKNHPFMRSIAGTQRCDYGMRKNKNRMSLGFPEGNTYQ
jgi:hypothetical protein